METKSSLGRKKPGSRFQNIMKRKQSNATLPFYVALLAPVPPPPWGRLQSLWAPVTCQTGGSCSRAGSALRAFGEDERGLVGPQNTFLFYGIVLLGGKFDRKSLYSEF